MIHFGLPKPITNNQRPYKDEKWHVLKVKHKMDKIFFLDSRCRTFQGYLLEENEAKPIQ
jgi:hypothetical protein